MVACPCCGAVLPDDRLIVDLNTNVAAYRGRVADLRPNHAAELVYVIAQAWPRTASYAEISQAGGLDEPFDWRNNMRVYVSLARKALSELGVSIVAVKGRGYRLEI